jgi:hypothetical protein
MMMAIASFLIDRLVSLAVSRICGVPGDYNLEFLELVAVYEIDCLLQACWRWMRPQPASPRDFSVHGLDPYVEVKSVCSR